MLDTPERLLYNNTYSTLSRVPLKKWLHLLSKSYYIFSAIFLKAYLTIFSILCTKEINYFNNLLNIIE